MLRPEIAAIAVPATIDGRNMSDGDFELTAGWGHFGSGQAVMPGQGRVVQRPYAHDELQDLNTTQGSLGETFCDVHPQRPRLLVQRPRRRLELQARRLPGAKEVALLPRARHPPPPPQPRRNPPLHHHRPPHRGHPNVGDGQMNRPIWIRRCLLFRRFILQLILKNLGRFIGRITSRDGFWWVAGIAAVLVIGVFLSWRFWEELGDEEESLSTTVRNVGLVIGGVVAILVAIWRSRVAERQAGAAQRQANTTQQNLLDERYQRGAEMLGSDLLAARLGGICGLQRLAEEHPGQYHIQIMELLCAFVRYPTGGERREEGQDTVEDVQIAVRAIGTRSRTGIELERKSDFRLDLFKGEPCRRLTLGCRSRPRETNRREPRWRLARSRESVPSRPNGRKHQRSALLRFCGPNGYRRERVWLRKDSLSSNSTGPRPIQTSGLT